MIDASAALAARPTSTSAALAARPTSTSAALAARPTSTSVPAASSASVPVSPASQKLVALDRLRRLGLIAALKEYFQHALANNIELIIAAISYEPQALAVEMELFRIAQEAISNAIRHGHAKVIRISLSIPAGQTQLLIEDDGCGALQELHDGVGLGSMRERAARLGGELTLGSTLNGGVSLRVRIPAQSFG